ncbi:MAG: transcription termination factor Rho [Candidatus Eisenbacteria bacterium]|nr:transcription termination factor Rho [Candidatus Eisenbacteria bacterium]
MLQRGTSIDPFERIRLEGDPRDLSTRAWDLIAPIGRGQRCLVVSPPKAGKTTLLIEIAHAVERNHPEMAVHVLLVDERPEEVTHFRRGVRAKVHAASSDLSATEHVERTEEAMAEVLQKVLAGEDVLLLLDSITRVARAYNNVLSGTGRTLTGGLDASTMQAPRQIFGAARKIEEGGSLTIVGTALVDTGSRMDEVIFQEFKGTGNTELVLSRDLFEKRIFPCIDIAKSGSRKEEKLVPPDLLPRLQMLRRVLAGKKPDEAMQGLLTLLQKFPTNEALLKSF